VFVKYNQTLKARYERKDVDPISLDDIDDSNEWLIGKMGGDTSIDEDAEDEYVFEDNEELTWGAVAKAAGVGESSKQTRSQTKKGNCSSKSKGKGILIEEFDANSEDIEENIEGYKSNEEEERDGSDYGSYSDDLE